MGLALFTNYKKYYTHEDNEYLVITITEFCQEDFTKAIEKLGYEPVGYKANMLQAIEDKLAFAIYKNEEKVGYIYNIDSDGRYISVSFNIWDDIALHIALKTLFEISSANLIRVYPHEGFLFLKSVFNSASLRMYNSGIKHHAVIIKDEIWETGVKLFRYLGIKDKE